MKEILRIGVVILSLLSLEVYAASHTVSQKNKNFTTKSLQIKVGDTVEFKNEDTVYHNIFSLSDVTSFDLGSYGPSETKKIVFDKPGTVEVECAVHKNMTMTIVVK